MTLGVVDCLQTVDIYEGDHQLFGSTTCTIYLPLKLRHAGAPPPHVGQLIGLRHFTVKRGLGAIARRQGAIVGGPSAFVGRPGAIVGRLDSIVRRPLTIARRSESLLLFSGRPGRLDRMLPRLGARIPHLGHPIAR